MVTLGRGEALASPLSYYPGFQSRSEIVFIVLPPVNTPSVAGLGGMGGSPAGRDAGVVDGTLIDPDPVSVEGAFGASAGMDAAT